MDYNPGGVWCELILNVGVGDMRRKLNREGCEFMVTLPCLILCTPFAKSAIVSLVAGSKAIER